MPTTNKRTSSRQAADTEQRPDAPEKTSTETAVETPEPAPAPAPAQPQAAAPAPDAPRGGFASSHPRPRQERTVSHDSRLAGGRAEAVSRDRAAPKDAAVRDSTSRS